MSENLQERINRYFPHKRTHINRNSIYEQNAIDYYTWQLTECKNKYNSVSNEDTNFRRILRSNIANMLRAYHKGHVEPQYKEVGLHYSHESVYEHVIPIVNLTQAYLLGVLNINEVLTPPVCLVSKTTDEKLKGTNVSVNYDLYNFFRRYAHLGTAIEFAKGNSVVDLDKWTLQDHYDMLS